LSKLGERPWLVDVALLLVAMAWGSSYLATKEVGRVEARIGVLLGCILSVVLLLETFGVAKTSATNAGLIISLTIVFTPLLDGGRMPPVFYLAACVALTGVLLLTQSHGFSSPSVGDLLMLLAAIVRAVHVTVMHRVCDGKAIDSGRLTLVQLLTVLAIFLATSPFVGAGLSTTLREITGRQWLVLVYLALVCTAFAFFIQMWAVRKTSPSRVSLLLGTEPVWAAAFGIALAGDRITVVGAIGAVLILVGINWGRRLEGRARTSPVHASPEHQPMREDVPHDIP